MGEEELQKASRDNSFQKFYSKTKQKNRTLAGGGSGSERIFFSFLGWEREVACVNVQRRIQQRAGNSAGGQREVPGAASGANIKRGWL